MKADDPITHQQLQHLATQGRKAVGARVVVLVASAYDEERKAKSNLVCFDCDREQDPTMAEQMATLAEVLALALGNVLRDGSMELILRNKETGETYDPMAKAFGRTMGEVDQS
jgi:hypothetical protein